MKFAAEQVSDPVVSPPLVDTVPFEHENVCEYAWLPPNTAALELAVVVVAWLNAGTEYECPFTVCVEAAQFALHDEDAESQRYPELQSHVQVPAVAERTQF